MKIEMETQIQTLQIKFQGEFVETFELWKNRG